MHCEEETKNTFHCRVEYEEVSPGGCAEKYRALLESTLEPFYVYALRAHTQSPTVCNSWLR